MLKRVYEVAEIGDRWIELDGARYELLKGKHAMYVPETRMKIIWSFNGRIEPFVDWQKGRNADALRSHVFNDGTTGFDPASLDSLLAEYEICRLLAGEGMMPPVDGFFHVKNVISSVLYGERHCDPRGCYGFYIEDARRMGRPGRFDPDRFRERFVDTGILRLSEGARGDLLKPDNLVNGYLVDVRRTLWDMMALGGDAPARLERDRIEYREDTEALQGKIRRLSQFPHKERKENYQSYVLRGREIDGTRKTPYRFDQMGIPQDLTGQSVVDLGCNLGAICCEAYRRGARQITGVDYEADYVECARDLARANGYAINYLRMDLTRPADAAKYFNAYYGRPVDIVFALSLYKHVRQSLWRLLEGMRWNVCYLESHNAPQGLETDHVKEMLAYLKGAVFMKTEYLGLTEDRSPRCVWKLTRVAQNAPAGWRRWLQGVFAP